MECGFCLQKDADMVEPKVLQCLHVHCLECLTENFNTVGVIRCPTCSEMYDITPERLPGADSAADVVPYCDICTTKGVTEKPAVTFCTSCCKKYCAKHREYHDELEDHTKVTIDEYRTRAGRLDVQNCSDHGEPLTIGCKECLVSLCVRCLSGVFKGCTDGKDHRLVSLEELVGELKKVIHELQSKLAIKEEQLDGLFKKTSEEIANHEMETSELIGRIHQTRDKQIETIREKYANLEKELIALRMKSKSRMSKFMMDDVGEELSKLSKHRMRIEARLKHTHQVDFLQIYQRNVDEAERLLKSDNPKLKLSNGIVTLLAKGRARNVELNLFHKDGFIDWVKGLTTSISTKLLRTMKLNSKPISVSHYRDNTYVGLEDGALRLVDQAYRTCDLSKDLGGAVFEVVVHKERIYVLFFGTPYTINVCGMEGQPITSWNPQISEPYSRNGFTIVGDQIIIPDRVQRIYAVYSLTGQTIKNIPFPLNIVVKHIENYQAICTSDDESFVVSDCGNNQVFRISVSTGHVIWSSTDIPHPLAVTPYGPKCLLVAKMNSNELTVLNANTGCIQSTITVEGLTDNTYVFDLSVCDGILALPAYNIMKTLFYQLA